MGEDPRIDAWLADHAYISLAGTTPEAVRADHDRLGSQAVAAGRAMMRDWLAALD
jgi:GMP synthase (glutamine-hydrolysing)